MAILVKYQSKPTEFEARTLTNLTRLAVQEALSFGQTPEEFEVSVLYVDDEKMKALNEEYRGIAASTDVLSFAIKEGVPLQGAPDHMLGDIVVSLDTARKNARRQHHSLRQELTVLLVHGTLHLLGYNHHMGSKPADNRRTREMQTAERSCLDALQAKLVI